MMRTMRIMSMLAAVVGGAEVAELSSRTGAGQERTEQDSAGRR